MKVILFCLVVASFSWMSACRESGTNAAAAAIDGDSTKVVGNDTVKYAANHIDCGRLQDKKVIDSLANAILAQGGNEHIWNLSAIDTAECMIVDGHFINTQSISKLIYLNGTAGMSAGTASHLLMLVDCSANPAVVWSSQIGVIDKDDIKDLNGDGIPEIVSRSMYTWMGECGDHIVIFNFKGGHRNAIYTQSSISVLDCGKEDLKEYFKQGDTLANAVDATLQRSPNNSWEIKEVRTVTICQGGASDEEIVKLAKVTVDSTVIKLF